MQRELFPSTPNKGEQARRKLLLAALKKFGDKGYDNASVREIADEAGQNVAAIAYYFGNKEKLYAAVLQGIAAHIGGLFRGIADDAEERQAAGTLGPAAAAEVIKRMLRTLLGEQFGGEFEKIRNVMMREQSSPSDSFGLLYKDMLKPTHELLTRMVGTAIGEDPASPVTILRAHALIGQVLAFAMARETILRRLGIKKLGAEHAAMIGDILDEHIEAVCLGLNPATR
ncbi:transcriptional regulator CecR [Luteolibacter marinus]|uniref:transcriptional regulator CecR n=1 Tax=Luteolibacter marinus TaxID=2776705 RepID=UPI00186757B8